MNTISQSDAQPTQGYFMVPASREPSSVQHTLAGYQNFPGAVSPNSGRRLLQLALINTADERLELETVGIEGLPLLYSWTCDIHQGEFSYRIVGTQIEILDFQARQVYTNFPYANYPDGFTPQIMELMPIDADDQKIILELNDRDARLASKHRGGYLDQPRHQCGGIPRLMQDLVARKCPRCKREMPLFASIADDNGTSIGFTGDAYVQVIYHLCRACLVITCYNTCD